MDKVSVLHIDSSEIWGGGQSQIATLIRDSADLPLEHFLASPKNSKLWYKVRQQIAGYTQLPRSGALNPLAMLRIRRFCVKNKIQIVHTHCGKSHTFAYWLKTLFMPQMILVTHRRIPAKIRSNWLSRVKFTGPAVDRFITVSDYIRSVLLRGGVDPSRMTTIRSSKKPFPCDGTIKQHARAELIRMKGLAPDGDFLIISASRLVPDKGLFILIEAFRLLVKQRPGARLIIAGEGPLGSHLKTTGRSLIQSGHLILPGFCKDIPRLLLGSDVFAIPSLSEGLGSTIVEAMMAKTAVVGSSVEGIPELVRHGQTGLLVPPGDAEALYNAFLDLAVDPNQRQQLAEKGYNWALSSCGSDVMVEKTFALYQSLI
jgi:glycosyltransferase involved in cell wall biosynthesis